MYTMYNVYSLQCIQCINCTMYIQYTGVMYATVSIQWTYKVLMTTVYTNVVHCKFTVIIHIHCTVYIQCTVYYVQYSTTQSLSNYIDYSLKLSGNDLCLKTNNYIFLSPKLLLFRRLIDMFVPDYKKT